MSKKEDYFVNWIDSEKQNLEISDKYMECLSKLDSIQGFCLFELENTLELLREDPAD